MVPCEDTFYRNTALNCNLAHPPLLAFRDSVVTSDRDIKMDPRDVSPTKVSTPIPSEHQPEQKQPQSGVEGQMRLQDQRRKNRERELRAPEDPEAMNYMGPDSVPFRDPSIHAPVDLSSLILEPSLFELPDDDKLEAIFNGAFMMPPGPEYPQHSSIMERLPRPLNFSGMGPGLQKDGHGEVPPSNTKPCKQHTGAQREKSTAADSGYASRRSSNDQRPHDRLRKHRTREQPEAQSWLIVDQQTEYTSPILPHGSDYIKVFCNGIHMKLKYDLQRHAHYRGRMELPRCLPDLIQTLFMRIGRETRDPSREHITHFLYTHYR